MREYMIVTQQIVGGEGWHAVEYHWDTTCYTDREEALNAGWREFGHDDFNIATLDGGRLVAFGFGMDDFGDVDGEPHGGYDLAEIAAQVGVEVGAATR